MNVTVIRNQYLDAKRAFNLSIAESSAELQAFVSNYLQCHHFHLDSFKKLAVLEQDKLEYDEAVLLSILYHE